MSGSGSTVGRRVWRPPPLGVLVLAALTYLPALTAKPGRMPTDTKLYLYLDPGRLIADAPFTWDTRQFAGWVPHQTIAYLWPSGPWFWTFEQLGVPDWVAHRSWIGTLVFLGGLGARWAARQLGMASAPAAVAGVVYCLSPYLLPYVSRTSVMLLPWMGLGWLVGLTVRATVRTRWRDVALFGLVVLTIGAVNATALALVAPAPVLWLVHAAWQRSISWRSAVVTALKLGGISVVVSLWWMVMLVVQGRHGADVLAFSETLEAVSLTSTSTETLRSLGYWLFYVRDPYAFTTTAAIDHLGSTQVILAGYLLTALCLLGLALVRWSQRRFAAWLVVTGIVLAVGVHPIDDPSPLMAPLRDSSLGLALRSSTRALPLSVLGLALGAASLVTLAGRVRVRGRDLGGFAAAAFVVVALVGIPAATSGGYVDRALERDQDVPAAWTDAVAALDAGSTEHRVLQLPGSEFGAFRWGYTVDPPLPGLTDKPLVTRDLLPLGSPGAMDLLYALDNRVQAGTVDPEAIAPVARLLGVDTIWVANDLAFDRFRTPRPELVAAMFAAEPDGLGTPVPYGDPVVNVPDIAMLDEQELSSASIGTPRAPVELVPVDDAPPIVRIATEVVVLAGSGDGIVDAAAAGLLNGDEAIVYAADLDTIEARRNPAAMPDDDTLLIVTDSARDRAAQWRGSQDVNGMTESGGPERDVLRDDSSDQRLAVFTEIGADEQTVALLDGGLSVRATGYGEPFALRPEDRPAMAVDGDPSTAWRVADRADPVGERIELSTTDGTIVVLQQQVPDATRRIAEIRVDAGDTGASPSSQVISLDDRSLTSPGQRVDVPAGVPVSITITRVAAITTGTDTGPSAVGFAELGPVALETVRLPIRGLDELTAGRPVAVVLTRDRVRPTNRWRHDPEPVLDRSFELPVGRTFDVAVTLRRDDRAPDALLDDLAVASGVATPDAASTRRLTGVPAARGSAAVDGDRLTAWTTPFGAAVGSALTVELAATANGPLTLVQSTDPRTSPITEIAITSAAGEWTVTVPAPDTTGASAVALPSPLAAGPVTFTITGVESRTTVDRRWAETVQLPASIAEIGGIEVVTRPVADASPVGCRSDLLTVDGTPMGVRVATDDLARLAAGDTVETELCTPDGTTLDLDPGAHRFRTATGASTGIHVDRLVLRSGEASTAEPVAAPTVERTRSTRTVTVPPCPTGCWLVLGEGYNPAWDGLLVDTTVTSLGPPVQVAGGFNGWWLSPSDTVRTATLRWTPQGGLYLALGIAFLGVVACVVLALADRRVRTTSLPVSAPLEGIEPLADRPRQAVAAAAVLVVAAGLAIAPVWALVAVVPAAVLVATRRSSSATLAASVTVGVIGLMVAWRQYDERFFPDAAWPARFDDLHRPGVFVVVLLLAGTWVDHTTAAERSATPHPSTPGPEPEPGPEPDDRTDEPATGTGGATADQDTAAATTEPAR